MTIDSFMQLRNFSIISLGESNEISISQGEVESGFANLMADHGTEEFVAEKNDPVALDEMRVAESEEIELLIESEVLEVEDLPSEQGAEKGETAQRPLTEEALHAEKRSTVQRDNQVSDPSTRIDRDSIAELSFTADHPRAKVVIESQVLARKQQEVPAVDVKPYSTAPERGMRKADFEATVPRRPFSQLEAKIEPSVQGTIENVEVDEHVAISRTGIFDSTEKINSESKAEARSPLPSSTAHAVVNLAATRSLFSANSETEPNLEVAFQIAAEELGIQSVRDGTHKSIQNLQPAAINTHQTAKSIAQQLVATITNQDSTRSEIQLNPKELGSVRMQLFVQDSTISLTILAERQETNDLMRRNIETLTEEFQQLGFESITFAFSENHDARENNQDERPFAAENMDEGNGNDVHVQQIRYVTEGLDLRL